MAKRDFTKGRGKFENPIELKYVQIPRDILQSLFVGYAAMPEQSRMLALWHFCYHYLTNQGYESLKVKDLNAYLLCEMMNEKTFVIQNNSRWKMWDEFYKQEDVDFDIAMDRYKQETREKKRELDRKNYQKRKSYEQLKLEREEEVNKILSEHLNNKNNKQGGE